MITKSVGLEENQRVHTLKKLWSTGIMYTKVDGSFESEDVKGTDK